MSAAGGALSLAGRTADAALDLCGVSLIADYDGALYWPEESLLAVSDLHFEKGSSFATRGILLPPYDTAATLARLERLIDSYSPRVVVALGDSFHDGGGPARLSAPDRVTLKRLQRGRDWIWIAGNHDPDPSAEIDGTFAKSIAIGPLTFRHEPTGAASEIAGHLHPSARITWRGRSVVRRCFAASSKCIVMPAFGAYTGGLSIRDRAFAGIFGAREFLAHVLGERRVYVFSSAHCG